jgi:hypothetical protein
MQVSNDEEGIILMLQSHTVAKRADIMTKVQAASWAVTSEEAGFGVWHGLGSFQNLRMKDKG